jgi:hypothetical protein
MRHRRLARNAVISVRGSIGINIRAIKHSGISLPHVKDRIVDPHPHRRADPLMAASITAAEAQNPARM